MTKYARIPLSCGTRRIEVIPVAEDVQADGTLVSINQYALALFRHVGIDQDTDAVKLYKDLEEAKTAAQRFAECYRFVIGGRTELDADELDELITKCIGPERLGILKV